MARTKQSKNARSPTDIDQQIGARIRARRLEQRVSQERLAEAIGLTFQQIQKYEKGGNRVSAATLLRIAEALDTDVALLMPRQAGLVADKSGRIYDPDVVQAALLIDRLNKHGRRIAVGLLESLLDDDRLKR